MKSMWPLFAECERLMSSESSYKAYRTALGQARLTCLPYLYDLPLSLFAPSTNRLSPSCRGVYLTDLTFIEDGNPDYVNELINFTKRSLIYTVISKIQQYQVLLLGLLPSAVHGRSLYVAHA